MSEGDNNDSDIQDVLDFYHTLAAPVKRRVRALKKLQFETVKLDVQFYKELFHLEQKYDVKHQDIFSQRNNIVTGSVEPTDDQCDWPSDDENATGADGDDVEKLCDEVEKNIGLLENNKKGDDLKGIPEFWLQALQNAPILSDAIEEHDVKILRHLTDVKCILHSDEPGFSLEFYFVSNDYFTNKVLTKRYYFNYDASPDEPFDYEGPEIIRAKGCVINWNQGKNVTVKLIKKVQKKKNGPGKRTLTKTVQEDSFFNFFNPPAQAISEDLDDDTQLMLEADFKLGQFMRDSVIPRAVLFFTGEETVELSDDDDDEDDDDDDDEDEDDTEEDDYDDDTAHQHMKHKRGGHKKHTAANGEAPECKQQ